MHRIFMRRGSIRGALAIAIFTAAAAAFASGAGHAFRILHTWTIGGNGGWDYLTVDPAAHALYIARGDRVQIVDTRTGRLAGEITGLKGIHGIALDTAGKYGYISDGRAGQVRVFDRATNRLTAAIPAGRNPDAILFEPKTQRVFAFNGGSRTATVIDARTRHVAATIPLPGRPEFAVADGRGEVFDNIESTSQMVRIDAASAKITAVWPLAPCESPSGLAIDREHERLFSVCGNKTMAVIDGNTGRVVAVLPIGEYPDAAEYDPIHHLAFSSNGEGTLTVVEQKSPDSYAVAQTLPTRRGARTMALDSQAERIYLVTADFGPRPAAKVENSHPWPAVQPGSFVVLLAGAP